jgi:hypothetical protein
VSDETEMALALIEEQADASIRRDWHDGRMFFSVIDVIGVLTDAPKLRMYWADMKRRIQDEGFRELLAFCQQLKMQSSDGKYYRTDAADTETILRIIQSVPSPKAEPVKQWLAHVGARHLQGVTQPLDAAQTSVEVSTITKPLPDAPAASWADYYESLATLYRRQAAYEAQLAYVDEQIDELHSRLESVEEVTRLVPELLERLGPQTLSPEHQSTTQEMVKRLHDLTGYAFSTIYTALNRSFRVGKYSDIPDARWPDVAQWFNARIAAAERRER